MNEKVNKDIIVELLRSFGLPDAIITRVFIYIA